MTTYLQQLTVLHTHLVAAGLSAAQFSLFSVDAEPEPSLHNCYYILGQELDLTDGQNSGGIVSDGDEIVIRILRYWGGEENATKTYTEAHTDMLNLMYDIESRTFGTGISTGRVTITNYLGRPEWLQLDMPFFINADTPRA